MLFLTPLLVLVGQVAAVTVYSQVPLGHATTTGTATATGDAADYTGSAAYNPLTLIPPPLPNPMPSLQFGVALQQSPDAMPGLSIPLNGSFMGFSIEMSVINQVLGKNSSYVQVPFLNLMANLVQRAGAVHIRVGGNTQETAVLVDHIDDGRILEKDKANLYATTQTPPIVYTKDVFYLLSNISSLVNVKWYLGIPFNDTANFRLGIVTEGEAILGDNLLAFQAGNEPDLYAAHNKRPKSYGPYDYYSEFGTLLDALDTNTHTQKGMIAPSVATGDWTPEMVWDTNFLPTYGNHLHAIAVEHYPDANCYAQFGVGRPRIPQVVFPNYLNHTSGQLLMAPYLNSSRIAQEMGKPMFMFETNTASCGGFPGVSDSFGAAIWAYDYALQMAHSNFSGAMFHVGGQNVYYNPFTAPPSNQTSFHQWTVGPVYYAALAMAETMGSTNTTRVLDMNANEGNIFTPAYAIYENDKPARAVLFNYMTDGSGASDLSVTLNVPGVGDTVYVKYLRAPSVSTKGGGISFAGQSFGDSFASDGRLQGAQDVKSVSCDTGAGTCVISVPAPSVALVFLSQDALGSSGSSGTAMTYPTTAQTRTHNTATIAADALATMNGMNGKTRKTGSTSKGSVSAAGVLGVPVAALATLAAAWFTVAARRW